MGQVIIKVPEKIYQEYEIESVAIIEKVLQALDKNVTHAQKSEKWKMSLLGISTWTEADIREIEKAREFINQWQPQPFF